MIAEYRVSRLLGQGGMGAVYEAEQARPHRTVALKIVRPGLVGGRMLRRFEHEAEVLGRLLHPGIAQIYEAGTADLGAGVQPFFAMELVRGEPLTRYARAGGLSTPQRLELMAKIGDAVQHAHQKGVIHRDLKPANILVTSDGQPKILDFGVARATDSDMQQTTQTDMGALVGTVPYMSPEQVLGDPAELDTRSDVYALGVVLFELLTDRLPYALDRRMVPEMARIIREEEPARLSSIDRSLRGDVETIVAHALEKDKSRRYQTASALSADIRRYLADEPITARPASTWYQARKFAKRNRVLVGGLAATGVALGAGLVGTTTYAVRENAQRLAADRARTESDRQFRLAAAANDFLLHDLLETASPHGSARRDITVREIVEVAAARMGTRYREEPEVEGMILSTLGKVLGELGETAKARPLVERGYEVLRSHLGEGHRNTVDALLNLASVESREDRLAEAEALTRRAVECARRLTPPAPHAVLTAENNLGSLLLIRGRREEAEKSLRSSLAWAAELRIADDEAIGGLEANLAGALIEQGRHDEGEALARSAMERLERARGMDHPLAIAAEQRVAVVLAETNRLGAAQEMLRELLERTRRVYGPGHANTARALKDLGVTVGRLGRLDEATGLYREALEVLERAGMEEHSWYLDSATALAEALRQLSRTNEAYEVQERVLIGSRAIFGDDHPDTLLAMNNLAVTCCETDRLDRGIALMEEMRERNLRVLGVGHARTIGTDLNLAMAYQRADRGGDAKALLEQMKPVVESGVRRADMTWVAYFGALAEVRLGDGDLAGADEAYREALAGARAFFPGRHPGLAVMLRRLALVLSRRDKVEEAVLLLEEGYDIRLESAPSDRATLLLYMRDIRACYEKLGDTTKAAEWSARLQELESTIGNPADAG